jgi:hypothetical protein
MKSGRDILSGYGNDSSSPKRPSATTGGIKQARDVMGYCPPQGPTNINDPKGPGLHGYNCGIANRPVGSDGACGSPGLHGQNSGIANKPRP